MENRVSDVEETRKAWIAPELKKIDVEVVTANEAGTDVDGGTLS